MAIPDFYTTLTQNATAEFKDRGSKFIAYAYPVSHTDAIKTQLQVLKKEHPKAVHFCYAYRLGIDGNNFRINDDGEPSGSAGRPILQQIDSKGVTNILVVVVRYFGGTLLGVPGLINAYKTATALALQLSPTQQLPVTMSYELQYDYSRQNEVMLWVKQMQAQVLQQEQTLFVLLTIAIPKSRLDEALYRLQEMHFVTYRKID
ncbi:MAG TPA: YigZ family protein [Chitinophagaceae bacterium]|nr:YigZ family protein [Chitinophagaceae bacterium]HAN38919.1 YigZ family protein [Chitinophagaceae bacterium]